MTAHTHRTHVDGCYRCELGRDEEREAARESIDEVLAELVSLRRWKEEATVSLNQWHAVFDLAGLDGVPGGLGKLRSALVLDEIDYLRDHIGSLHKLNGYSKSKGWWCSCGEWDADDIHYGDHPLKPWDRRDDAVRLHRQHITSIVSPLARATSTSPAPEVRS